MNHTPEARSFVETQKSLQFYPQVQESFVRVLSTMPEKDFRFVTRNLILVVLHEGAVAQVMHFPPSSEKFRVLQMTIPTNVPDNVLDWVVAHELGHVAQDRNWEEGDGDNLEHDASQRAAVWGFEKTNDIESWLEAYRKQFDVT